MSGPRAYTPGTRAALAAFSGGVCYFPGCDTPIIAFVGQDPLLNVEIAHIRDANRGNRYDPSMTDEERRNFANLILLCRPHHVVVDKTRPNEYPIKRLQAWKEEREGSRISQKNKDRFVEVAEAGLHLLELPLDPGMLELPSGDTLTPFEILWPKFRIVPFLDHGDTLRKLEEWCAKEVRISAMFVDGVGGMGKTRAAAELCQQRSLDGWLTGFWRAGAGDAVKALRQQHADQLIVFDYANDSFHQIVEFIDELLANSARGNKIRLLLLTRSAGVRDRKRGLTAHQTAAALLLDRAETLTLGSVGPEALNDAPFPIETRRELFSRARNAILQHLGAAPLQYELDLSDETYSVPLFVVLAAILSINELGVPEHATQDDILSRILDRESVLFWTQSPEPDSDLRAEIVCVPTIAPVASEAVALSRIATLGYSPESPLTRRTANWLRDLYPGSNWANALEPDVLGEFLLRMHLRPGLAVSVIQSTIFEASVAMRVLGRILNSWPDQDTTGTMAAVVATLPPLLEDWVDRERAGDIVASDGLESASVLVEHLPSTIGLPPINLPGRLGPAGNNLAIAAARKWLIDEPLTSSPVARLRLKTQLAERLGRAGEHVEALDLAVQVLSEPILRERTTTTVELEARALLIQGRALLAGKRPFETQLLTAIERLDSLEPAGRAALAGLDATVRAQYVDALRFRHRYDVALRKIHEVIEIRRRVIESEGPAHIPALAASLRVRASLYQRNKSRIPAEQDILEAITLLRSIPLGPANVFDLELARCLERSASIQAEAGQSGIAAVHLQESVEIRFRLAETFGINAQIDLVGTLVRNVNRSRTDRDLYFEDAARLVASLAESDRARSAHRAELVSFANQLAAHAPSEADAQRVRHTERDLELSLRSELDTSHHAIEELVQQATSAARMGQHGDALAYWRSAVRISDLWFDHGHVLKALPSFVAAFVFHGRVSESVRESLDRIVGDSSSVIARDSEIGQLWQIDRLTTMAFIVGWLERAGLTAAEESTRAIMRALQEQAINSETVGLARGFALVEVAVHHGNACRSSVAGQAGPSPLSGATLGAAAPEPRTKQRSRRTREYE